MSIQEGLSYGQIHEALNNADLSRLPNLAISVLRNIVIEPIEPYLRAYAYQMERNATVTFGEYDNIFQEAVGGRRTLLNPKTDYVLVYVMLEMLSWDLARNFAALTAPQIQAEVERIQEFIGAVGAGIRRQTEGMILWHGFENPVDPALGIMDSQTDGGQRATVAKLNEFLRSSLRGLASAYFVDTNACVARVGATKFYDWRTWHIARAPYSREALRELAREDAKFIRAKLGKGKKCLVLDCDNVLWGGTVGEDGLVGLKLGRHWPGAAFWEFQSEVLNLHRRGVLVALCSKNNPEDVWQVFREHPDMVLREEHIAAAQINWQDKATNLRQIALDLNIGLDSLVFADDSEFEINLVRHELPEVEVIHLPQGRPAEYRPLLASSPLFETLTISDEDRQRGAMYRAESSRKRLLERSTDLESYLQSLDMVATIRFADDFSIPRIAQQTQRTNQLNLTTRRYGDAEIRALAQTGTADIIYLRLQDRFGDSGIVGTCILRYEGSYAIFDTFLVSCRVLGRGVEDVLLIEALRLAKNKLCTAAIGEFYATKKNGQAELFYAQHGFKETDAAGQKADRVFRFDLSGPIPRPPTHFKSVATEIA